MAEQQAQGAVLFSDVSGSTKLYETAGDQVAKAAVDECVRIMRDRTGAAKGRVIKTMGDEVMSVFPTADAAADAAMMFVSLPIVDQVLPPADESMTTRVRAAVAAPPSRIRTL